ncbi:hypothetical protein GCM10027613_04580 [Microlunatus endophyticus]
MSDDDQPVAGPMQLPAERGEPGRVRVHIVRAGVEGGRYAETRQIGRHHPGVVQSDDDRQQPVMVAPEAVHRDDGGGRRRITPHPVVGSGPVRGRDGNGSQVGVDRKRHDPTLEAEQQSRAAAGADPARLTAPDTLEAP